MGLDSVDHFESRLTEPFRYKLQSAYNTFVRAYFHNDRVHEEMIISMAIAVGVYWVVGTIYLLIEMLDKPKWLLRYKIQPNKSQVNYASMGKLLPVVLLNQVISGIISYHLIVYKHSNGLSQTQVPTLTRFLVEWTVFILVREVLFYYSHRVLHSSLLYKYIHKRHHEWQTPVALTAIYCHPLEHLISNVFPAVIGPVLMHSHNLVSYVWLMYVILLTLNDHCGYHFPWTFTPLFHDYHHLKFNVNYGILGLLDWLHGTDKQFRDSPYFKRHRMYFGLTPPGTLKDLKE